MDNLPFKYEWVLHLDADECLTPALREEIGHLVSVSDDILDGYYIKRRFMWMGRWLRYGRQYPGAELRLFRRHLVRVMDAGHREYIALRGRIGILKNDMIHESFKGLSRWIEKHNKYSSWEAHELLSRKGISNLSSLDPGEMLERKTRVWQRKMLNRMPSLARPFLRFAYRYILQLGFLDGVPGFLYYLAHDLWYPLLIEAKFMEANTCPQQ